MSPAPHILMCPPDHYGIEYEINPWMNRERQADHALAVPQRDKQRHLTSRRAGAGPRFSRGADLQRRS